MKKILRSFGNSRSSPTLNYTTGTRQRDKGIVDVPVSTGYQIRNWELGKFHRAVWSGDVQKVQRLLQFREHDLNKGDRKKRTPLHLASAKGYPDVIALLLGRKCNVNVTDIDKCTPLMKAIECQHEACASILLQHEADVNLEDKMGNTALHYAASSDNTAIARKLLHQKVDIEAKNKMGYTPLLLAISKNKESIVEFFIKNGANVNAYDGSKRTALMIAINVASTDIIKLLFQQDVNLTCRDCYGWSVEEYAVVRDFPISLYLRAQERTEEKQIKLPSSKTVSSIRPSNSKLFISEPAMGKEDKTDTKETEKKAVGLEGQEDKGTVLKDYNENKKPKGLKEQRETSEDDKEKQKSEEFSPKRGKVAAFEDDKEKQKPEAFLRRGGKIAILEDDKEKQRPEASSQQEGKVAALEDDKDKKKPEELLQRSGKIAVREDDKEKQRPEAFFQRGGKIAVLEDDKEKQKPEAFFQQGGKIEVLEDDKGKQKPELFRRGRKITVLTGDKVKQKPGIFFRRKKKVTVLEGEKVKQKSSIFFQRKRKLTELEGGNVRQKLSVFFRRKSKVTTLEDGKVKKKPGIFFQRKKKVFEDDKVKQKPFLFFQRKRKVTALEDDKVKQKPFLFFQRKRKVTAFEGYRRRRATAGSKDDKVKQKPVLFFRRKRKVTTLEGHEVKQKPVVSLGRKRKVTALGVVEESSEEETTVRHFDTLGTDEFWSSTDEDLEYASKKNPKSNLMKLLTAFKIKRKSFGEKSNTIKRVYMSLLGHRQLHSKKKDVAYSFPKDSSQCWCFPYPELPLFNSFSKPPWMKSTLGINQLEEEKNKHQHYEIKTLEEKDRSKLTQTRRIHKVREVFSMNSNQNSKDEGNKMKRKNLPITSIPFTKKISASAQHLLKGDSAVKRKDVKKLQRYQWISDDPTIKTSLENVVFPPGFHYDINTSGMDNDEGSDSTMKRKPVQKPQRYAWFSEDLTIKSSLEKETILSGFHYDENLSEAGHDKGRTTKKILDERKKITMKMDTDGFDDLTQSSDTSTGSFYVNTASSKNAMSLNIQLITDCKDSGDLLRSEDTVTKYKRSIELNKGDFIVPEGTMKGLENKITSPQELSAVRNVACQLEKENEECDRELCRIRLKEEEEKRLTTEVSFVRIREELRRREELFSKELELKEQLEHTLRTQDVELRQTKNYLKQVEEEEHYTKRRLSLELSTRTAQEENLNDNLLTQNEEAVSPRMIQSSEVTDCLEEGKNLLSKNIYLQHEVSRCRLKLDKVKMNNQAELKRYSEENEILKGKNEELEKQLKLKEEEFTKTVILYRGKLNVLTTENTLLNSKITDEKQNRDRLEKEMKSYHCHQTAPVSEKEPSQTQQESENSFQRERVKYLHLMDQHSYEFSSLRERSDVLCQQFYDAENKVSALEHELHGVSDSLRKKTWILENAQRNLHQVQYQAMELEHKNQIQKEKLDKSIMESESLQKRIEEIQRENLLFQQQLEDNLPSKIPSDNEEKNQDLINEHSCLSDQMVKYKNYKAEREDTLRQLQKALDESLKKLSQSETSLEVTSYSQNNLQNKIRQQQKEIDEVNGELGDKREKIKKIIDLNESVKNHLDQEMKRNSDLQEDISGFEMQLKTRTNELKEYEEKDFHHQYGYKHTDSEMNRQTIRLQNKFDDLTQQLKETSSKCIQLELKNQGLQNQLYSKTMETKKWKEVEKNKRQLEEEADELKGHLEMNKLELNQIEQYRQMVGEQVRKEIGEKLSQVNMFLQVQAEKRDYIDQLRDDHDASVEQRIRDLESALHKEENDNRMLRLKLRHRDGSGLN